MITLQTLAKVSQKRKARNRVGRGIGSGNGKTCGRGHKGSGSRSGYKRRQGYEGGQLPLFRKLPTRGFSNVRFQKRFVSINLRQIDLLFKDGEVVNESSLRMHGFVNGKCYGIKILGDGELKKKISIEANAFSKGACEKLDKLGLKYEVKTAK